METDDIIKTLSSEATDEAAKLDLLQKKLPEGDPPEEKVIQAIMRIIRKPNIPEASEGVYDAAVSYLKSIQRY